MIENYENISLIDQISNFLQIRRLPVSYTFKKLLFLMVSLFMPFVRPNDSFPVWGLDIREK